MISMKRRIPGSNQLHAPVVLLFLETEFVGSNGVCDNVGVGNTVVHHFAMVEERSLSFQSGSSRNQQWC